MPAFICTACGVQYPPSDEPPVHCTICEEERQFVPDGGQGWTTLEALRLEHVNRFRQYEPGIIGIGTTPKFGIGQRALLVQTKGGNVLWDCFTLIDDATVTMIKGLGGIKAIAVSHPHFYSTIGEWSRAFGGVPVYLNAADREWVMQPDPAIKFWEGKTLELWDGVTVIRCGGHFPGGSALHWRDGANGKGVLCAADIVNVNMDRKSVSFMRSYPNFIPLSAAEVTTIGKTLEPYAFDRIYSHFFGWVLKANAKAVVRESVARYVAAVNGTRGVVSVID